MGLRIDRRVRPGDREGRIWRANVQAQAAKVKAEREAADAQAAAEAAYQESQKDVTICCCHLGQHPENDGQHEPYGERRYA